jgi:hypothetical protein
MALKKARVLRDGAIGGVEVNCNQVVLIDEKVIKAYTEDGLIDANPDAVAYCEKELGAKAQKPGEPAAAAVPTA